MLIILNVIEESGNYETLGTEDEMLQEKVTKNTHNSNHICHILSIYLILKNDTQELLKKKLNKTINEVKANEVISFKNKSKDTNKKRSNNNKDSKNENENVTNISMMLVTMLLPNNGNMDNCKDKSKNMDDARKEHHKDWINNSDNTNNGIDQGKDKVFDKNDNNIEDGDCTKKDKGEFTVNNNYFVVVVNNAGHRCKTNLLNEDLSNANYWFVNKIMRNVKENKHKMYNVPMKHIVRNTNKEFHNVDNISIKYSNIPGTNMNTNTGNRKSIYSNTGI